MAKLGQYTSQVSVRPVGGPRVSASDFSTGSAMRGLAQATGQLAQVLQEKQLEKDNLEYQSRLADFRLQSLERAAELQSEEGDLQEVFQKDFEERAQSLEVPASMRTQLQTDLGKLKLDYVSRGITAQAQRDGARQRENFENIITKNANAVLIDPSLEKEAIESIKQASATVSDPALRVSLAQSGIQKIRESTAQAQISANPQAFKSAVQEGEYSDLENLQGFLNKADAEIKSREILARQKKTEANAAINTIKDRLEAGMDIPPDEMALVEETVKSSGSAEMKARLDQLQTLQGNMQVLRTYDPVTLQNVINSEFIPATRKNGATEFEALQLEMAQNLLTNMNTEIERDPVSFAAQAGTPVQPIDLTSPESIRARLSTATSVAEKYRTDVKPLTDEEVASLSTQIRKASGDERFEMVSAISSAAGMKAGHIYEQLGQEDNVFAHAGGLMLFSPNHTGEVRKMLRGQKALEENPDRAPAQPFVDLIFSKYVGAALKQIPAQEAALKDAAIAHYVATKYDGASFDQGDFKDSLRVMLGGGGVANINKLDFILPANVTKNDFEDMLERATDDTYKFFSVGGTEPTYSDGRRVTARDIERHGQFETVGHGMYRVKINDRYLLGGAADGTYVFQIDSQAIEAIR